MNHLAKSILGIVLVLSICLNASANPSDPDSIKTKAVVEALFAAFNRHDLEGVVALYSPDARLVTPGFPEPRYGLNVVREEYQSHFENIPGVHDEVVRIIADGNQAAVEFTASWEQPTEDEPDARGVLHIAAFITIENGKIVEDIAYFDRKALEPTPDDQP
jgi:uncharacterized protein (TIGR02246 family)